MERAKYKFLEPNTVLFLTGIPLSGKSTVTPLVAAAIEGCAVQSMDIFRLFAQELENRKPKKERNPYVLFGSCDSFRHIGNGKYTPENLIIGFNNYAKVVSSLLPIVLPNLESQGVRDMIFEGVQLTPNIVKPYLKNNNKLIVLTTDKKRIGLNRDKIFGNDEVLLERYADERLGLLQNEILTQAKSLPQEKVLVIDNSEDFLETAKGILKYLEETKTIGV